MGVIPRRDTAVGHIKEKEFKNINSYIPQLLGDLSFLMEVMER